MNFVKQFKKRLIFSLFAFLTCMSSQAQITKTVGSSGADYTTLKGAFDAINTGTLTGSITL